MATQKKSFAPGDKVRLNIGGPVMVVKSQSDFVGGQVTCQWFVGKKLESGQFAPETLRRVAEEDAEGGAVKKKPTE